MKLVPELFNVLPPDEAYQLFLRHFEPIVRREAVPTAAALDRVTALPVLSYEDLPAFTRATMDGYSVRAADSFGASEGAPAYLKVAGEVPMGATDPVGIGSAECAVAYTGGMLARGADAVVMVEHTQQVDATTIEVVRAVAPGENCVQVGEDVREGEGVLPAGHRIRPQDIGALMALGITSVEVARKPVVAIVSSGDEVISPGEKPKPGQIRDINSYTCQALVQRAGGEPRLLGIAPDRREALEELARRGLEDADMLVMSAGSSVSSRDMTAQVIASLGQPGILLHGVSIHPGKPTILAIAGGKPVFGLPGNPVSAMVLFELMVAPTIKRMLGQTDPDAYSRVFGRLTRRVASAPGREDYVQARLEERDGELWAEPVFGKSNLIFTMVKADGMIHVPLDRSGIEAGDVAEIRLF
ncbi:MAG TPA: gephyrin-like molybdotransferase Glp [Chloroflexota bacterium]|nr:gephyrin-like molybdotransferase Glp [Chloroflexota bacterium]